MLKNIKYEEMINDVISRVNKLSLNEKDLELMSFSKRIRNKITNKFEQIQVFSFLIKTEVAVVYINGNFEYIIKNPNESFFMDLKEQSLEVDPKIASNIYKK